jgi:Domain of unknown function (DUF4253)
MFFKKILGLGKNEEVSVDKALEMGFSKEALILIREVSDSGLHHLIIRDLYEEVKIRVEGISFTTFHEGVEDLILNLQPKLRPFGLLVFIVEKNFGRKNACKIGIIKGNHSFEIIDILQTNGENYDISNEDILAKLRTWDKQYTITLIGGNHDWLEIQFSILPSDRELVSLVKDIYEFCPDMVDEGSESFEELVKEIMETKSLYLWWD